MKYRMTGTLFPLDIIIEEVKDEPKPTAYQATLDGVEVPIVKKKRGRPRKTPATNGERPKGIITEKMVNFARLYMNMTEGQARSMKFDDLRMAIHEEKIRRNWK